MTAFPSPVLILGARSDIARALARHYVAEGCEVILGARDAARLAPDVADLTVRGRAAVTAVEFDVLADDPDGFFARLGRVPGTVVMVAGLLGDQAASMADDATGRLVMETNYVGPARYLMAAARAMRAQGHGQGEDKGRGGCLIGVSSVAGERGRGSNFIYGSAKAGFTALLSGLRNSLLADGIAVMTVKPGFVRTAMTAGMALPPALTASADQVAQAILAAQRRGRDVVYAKPVWRPIMAVIRAVPESVFKRLSL